MLEVSPPTAKRPKPTQQPKDELIFDGADLAPFVTDIKESLHGRAVIEAIIILAQASHDVLGNLPQGAKLRRALAKMIASPHRPGLKSYGILTP